MKRLTYDGIRICKKVAIIFNHDGKAAFDRMIPSVGPVALRRLGASENSVKALLSSLEHMKYRLRTALGISEDSFNNVQYWVLGTTLQGSGASQSQWLAIACMILGAISKRSPGLSFSNPRRTRSQSRAAETYVNDTELFLAIDIKITSPSSGNGGYSTVLGTVVIHHRRSFGVVRKVLFCGSGLEIL